MEDPLAQILAELRSIGERVSAIEATLAAAPASDPSQPPGNAGKSRPRKRQPKSLPNTQPNMVGYQPTDTDRALARRLAARAGFIVRGNNNGEPFRKR